MRERDSLHRFLFERLAIRGELVRLDSAWQTVLERRRYPAPVRQVLGEAMAAAALLHATIKFDGLLTLQLQSTGPLRLVVVQCTGKGELRAVARWSGGVTALPLAELCTDGRLALTLDPGSDTYGSERYQGIVGLEGATLSAALEHYFNRSEQLPTRLQLVADEQSAAGLLLQRLPEESADMDAWERIQQLGATLTRSELLTLDARSLVRRLFHQEDVRLYPAQPLAFRCTCSRERTEAVLAALGYAEIKDILAEEGEVNVACEFCGRNYRFDTIDIGRLFVASPQPLVPPTRH
jgi:molecular chaperone Hsp33